MVVRSPSRSIPRVLKSARGLCDRDVTCVCVRFLIARRSGAHSLCVISQDIKISAGHEFIVTVDPQYAESCDDKRLFMDYANLPAVTAPGKLIYVDDGEWVNFLECIQLM